MKKIFKLLVANALVLTILFSTAARAAVGSQCEMLFEARETISIPTAVARPHFDIAALSFVKDFVKRKDERAEAVNEWSRAISTAQLTGRKLSIVEHTVLQLVLRTKQLGLLEDLDFATVEKLRACYGRSWADLGGQPGRFEKIIARSLPRSALAREESNVQSFHRIASRVDPTEMAVIDGPLTKLAKKLLPLALLTFGLTNAFALSNLGMPPMIADFLSAAAIGHSVALVWEHYFHGLFMHGGFGGKLLPKIYKSRLMPKSMRRVAVKQADLHASHHSISPKTRYTLEENGLPTGDGMTMEQHLARLEKMGVPKDTLELLEGETRFGFHSEKNFLEMFFYTSPPAIILGALTAENPFVGAFVGAVFSQSWLYNIYYFHEYYHVTLGKVKAYSNIALRMYLTSPLFKQAYRHHHVHHGNVRSNWQLLPGIQVDSLLGTEKPLTMLDLAVLLEQDLNF